MANTALVPALAKLLVALAWTDGTLHPEEEATVKEVLGLLSGMTAREWAVIELYLVAPVGDEERALLLDGVVRLLTSRADQQLVLDSINALVAADNQQTSVELQAAATIREAISAADVSVLGRAGRLLRGTFSAVPAREQQIELWLRNPVAYAWQLQAGTTPDATTATAALAAGIMLEIARLSHSAATIRPIIATALERNWSIADGGALADAALSLWRRDLDFHRISRELVNTSRPAQRTPLLDTLFRIANAEAQVSPDEIDLIRVITERLQLPREQYVDAKLRIPSADRRGL